jgi:hypothetical protein
MNAVIKIGGATAACALGLALIVPQFACAETAAAQPSGLNRTDLRPAALRQASALIEQYVQPIAELQPTSQQKRAIESAMKLLESDRTMKQQYAIEQLVKIGPAALGDLRGLAASAPPEHATAETPAGDAYPATIAGIVIRRIEAAQRQPIIEQLISLGDEARVVLSQKLEENRAAVTKAKADVEAATAALVKASANTTLDASATAGERRALSEAQAAQKQAEARQGLLLEISRLTAAKPPVEPPARPQEPSQPPTPPADVLAIEPISSPMSPPTGSFESAGAQVDSFYSDSQDMYLFGGGFETWANVHDYSRRGFESRGAAQLGGGAHPGGGAHAGSGKGR